VSIVYEFIMFWVRVGAYVFYRAQILGRENLPKDRSFLLAGNHVSVIDPLFFASYTWPLQIHYMAKEELFSMPILSWLVPRLNAFPVSRDKNARAALATAMELLQSGKPVGIFPEGGRNRDGEHVIRLGGAWLANQAGAPVVPCAIAGSEDVMPFRAQIKVAYGKPIYPPAGKATKDDLANFTTEIMRSVEALYEEIGGNSEG
jgi:1-acyl-sn-glycerol-3-phosphate acyltransferase